MFLNLLNIKNIDILLFPMKIVQKTLIFVLRVTLLKHEKINSFYQK